MNFKKNESATKLRGGYYTDAKIAAFLLRWVMQAAPRSLLEPSCGDGAFFTTLAGLGARPLETVEGFEIELGEAMKARQAVRALGVDSTIHARDFLGWAITRLMMPPSFDAAVGNPPFIRYQYLDAALQSKAEEIFRYFGLPFTRHTNAWVPFVIASVALLRPRGRLAMVVPAELLHVLHAQSLRTYLANECSRILVFDPEELWFADTLQGAVLLLAEKKASPKDGHVGLSIIQTRSPAFLQDEPEKFFIGASYSNGETVSGKWMPALLTAEERSVIRGAASTSGVSRFVDVADVDVGIVTGANKFFLVPDAVVRKHGLSRFAHPAFGRSEHVPGVIYDARTHASNRAAGLPTNLLWFKKEGLGQLPKAVQEYIKDGEKQSIHRRYKCRIRDPWYAVPSVYASPIGMLKRSHDYPRLILNEVAAFTTDTAYRISIKQGRPADFVCSFVNSLTALSAELEGRHYGGGVLELVPSEIEKLLVPLSGRRKEDLAKLDSTFRRGEPAEAILLKQDECVLGMLGFSKKDRQTLHAAWWRLRSRRHRNHAADADEESSDL